MQCGRSLKHLFTLYHRIGDNRPAIRGNDIHQIGHRRPEVRTRIDSIKPQPDSVERAHIARVAVRIPGSRGGDGDGFLEIVSAQQNGRDHHGVVGNHMAAAWKYFIAVFRIQVVTDLSPVRFSAADIPDITDHIL